MASGGEGAACDVQAPEPTRDVADLVLKPTMSPEIDEQSEDEEEQKVQTTGASNGHQDEDGSKRVRKKVQRLSETLSKAHDERIEQRTKAAKELFEGGSGTPLGDIPRIEASLRKVQPITLKPLHLIIYGRFGTISEVRSNLRKFRGFPFEAGSPEYTKKLLQIEQRPLNELREALRILSLEVTGTREVVATRLLDFCLKPSADKVKYKGKVNPSKRTSKKETSKKTKKKPSALKISKRASNEDSSKDQDQTEEDISSDASSVDVPSSGEEYSSTTRTSTSSKRKRSVKRPVKHRVTLQESESEPETKESDEPSPPKRIKKPVTSSTVDSDEDTPLAALANSSKPRMPSDSEIKESIVTLLKTVNLEETSLRVVREQIASRYPGVDLAGKKEFINTTVKEYLAQS